MIALWHCVRARSFRPLWMLEELGLPYTLRMLPFPPRAHAKAFLKENPLGTVPLLEHGLVRMTESGAMCQYMASLAPSSSLAVSPSDAAYGSYLDWLHAGDATLTVPQTLVLRYTHFEPPARCQPQVVEDYRRIFHARLKGVDGVLQRDGAGGFLCAGRFTAADVSVGYALSLAGSLGLEEGFSPALAEYWARLQSREAFKRAVAAEYQAALDQGIDPTPAPELRPFARPVVIAE